MEIQIRDTGKGIPKEDLDKVFDPFYTTKESGTGLGLAITNGIIDQHGGVITVSTHVGAGQHVYYSIAFQTGYRRSQMSADTPRILIVDDEINICRNCEKILSKMDCEVSIAQNGHDALALIEAEPFDVVVTDLKMSRMGGMEVLRRIKENNPDIRVIVITGYASVSSAVEVMKIGAFDYLPKPFTPHELRAVVLQAITDRMTSRQNQRLKNSDEAARSIAHQLIGNSHQIQKVVSMIQKVSPTDSNVLVYGESGTGKELVARAVHANSHRKDGVFFAVDCGTLSGNLLASELFGHVKGAFTGAHQGKKRDIQACSPGNSFSG